MKTYDLIPDIHGQAEKFTSVLTNLGYFYRNGTWRHSDTDRTCIFLGDYIDRGHGNRSVLTTVRSMVDSGVALAIMGKALAELFGASAKKDFTSGAPQACVDMRFVYTGEENGLT